MATTVPQLRADLLAALRDYDRHRREGRDLAAGSAQRRADTLAAAIVALVASEPVTDDMALARAVGVTPDMEA